MVEAYQQRVRVEKRWGIAKALGLNFLLVLYFLGGLAYLAGGSPFGLAFGPLMGILLPLSLALGAAWTRSRASAGRVLIESTNKVLKQAYPPLPARWLRTPSGAFTLLVLALTLVLGWRITDIDLNKLFGSKGMAGARRIFSDLVDPVLDAEFLGLVLEEMVVTIYIALVATLIAVPIAFCVSFPMARNLMKGNRAALFVYSALRLLFNFTRSVEPIIWAVIFVAWVSIGPFTGMLALMVHSVASLAKLYSEQVESVENGPIEAIEATGAGKVQMVWYAVVPQIVLPYLSFTIYRWDINVRMATIIGLVGGGGIGGLLVQYYGQSRWREVGTMVLVIAVVVWIMDYASAKLREAIA